MNACTTMILDFCRDKSIKLSQLSRMAGLRPSAVPDLVRTDRSPTPRLAEALAPVLGVSPEALLGDDPERN